MRNSPDAAAQKMGFANAETLHAVVQIGQHLKAGKQITNRMVDTLAGAYPAIPKSVIFERAVAVNQLPPAQRFNAFATEVGGEGSVQAASALVDSYGQHFERETFVDDLNTRLDSRQTEANKTMSVPQVDHRSELRRALENQFKAPMPKTFQGARNVLADQLEKNQRIMAQPESHSLRDTIGAAFDKPMLDDAFTELTTDFERDQIAAENADTEWTHV